MSVAKDQAFKDYVVREVLRDIDGITARAMFGGWGIYRHGLFFAMIADGRLFFKVDDSNRGLYEAAGSQPFIYHAPTGKEMVMQYYELPAEVQEDREQIRDWVEQSCVVVQKKKEKKK